MNNIQKSQIPWINPEKVLKNPDLWPFEIELCKRDFWYCATRWIKTKDPLHKPTIRPFPSHLPHLKIINELFEKERTFIILKSRRMFMTWFFMARTYWLCRFHDNQSVAIQSKKELDAQNLLGKKKRDKLGFIILNEPPFFKKFLGDVEMQVESFYFPNGSDVMAIPEGSDHLRQYAFSLALLDEAAKQDDLESTLGGAVPTLEGTGKFVLLSTTRPGYLARLAKDKTGFHGVAGISEKLNYSSPLGACLIRDKEQKRLETWDNSLNGYRVIRLHYSADLSKDPNTPEGKMWLCEVKKGMSESLWNQEYEIDETATAEGLVYPEFSPDVHVRNFNTSDITDDMTIYHALDPGIEVQTAGLWGAVSAEQDLYIFDEYYETDRTIEINKFAMNEKESTHPAKPLYSCIDPYAFKRDLNGFTIADYYASGTNEPGRLYVPANNDVKSGIAVVAMYLNNTISGNHPAIFFSPKLTNLINEIEEYSMMPEKDKPRKGRDHLMDCLRYMCKIPPTYIPKNTISTWKSYRNKLTGSKFYYNKMEEDDETR